MMIDLDGFALLRAIGANPDRLDSIRGEARNAGAKLLLRHVKAQASDPRGLRDVRAVIGDRGLVLILDGLSDAELRNLARRVDPHHRLLSKWDGAELRRHLAEIGRGLAPVADPRGAPVERQEAVSVFSPAFSAVWDGRDE